MSRATMKTKYKTVRGFDNKMKAQKFLEALKEPTSRIKERIWAGKDKRRFYVQTLTRKGRKV